PGHGGELAPTRTASFLSMHIVRTRGAAAPALALKVIAPASRSVGDKVDFQLEVTNPNASPATDVVLNVRLPGNLQHAAGAEIEADLGSLAAGAVRKVKLQTTAVQAGPAAIRAIATAPGGMRGEFQTTIEIRERGQLQLPERDGPANPQP